MEPKRAYSAKGVLTALGKSLLYLLFFLAIQFLAGIIYAVIAVAGASLFHGEADAGSVLAGTETAVLFAYLLTAAAILLLWFRLRHKPLGEAAGLRRCSGWTAAFCAFAAVGLFVVLQLALALLPEAWMTDYSEYMDVLLSDGLLPAVSIVLMGPLAEELMFRGVIQTRLARAMPAWIAVVLQAVLFGVTHGTPIQMAYAFLIGLALGFLRSRTGSILPGFAAHAAFNAMNGAAQRRGRRLVCPCRHGGGIGGGLRVLPPGTGGAGGSGHGGGRRSAVRRYALCTRRDGHWPSLLVYVCCLRRSAGRSRQIRPVW